MIIKGGAVCAPFISQGDKYMNDKKRMEELVAILNEAAEAYYAKDIEIMANVTYDALYYALVAL